MQATTVTVLSLIIFALTAVLCEGKMVFINILKKNACLHHLYAPAGRVDGKAERCLCQKKAQERVRPALLKTFEIFPPSASCPDTEIM